MKRLAILFFVTVLMLFLYGQIDYTAAPWSTWDLEGYRRMAAVAPAIATDMCQPIAYRVLGPWIVGMLPVPDVAGFHGLTVLASIVLVFLSYYFFRTVGLSPNVAVITVILYTFNTWWFGMTAWDFFQVNDLMTQIWIVILFLAMLKGRWLLFGATLLVGALTREPSMLMIPVVGVYLWERKELRRQGLPAFAAIVPGLALFLLLRAVIPATCGKPLFEQLVAYAGTILSPIKITRLLFNSYLPFSLLPWVFFRDTLDYFRTRKYALVFVIMVFLSTMFGLDYADRLLAPSFVVIYDLIGRVVQKHYKDKVFLAVLLVGGFLSSFHHLRARFPLPDRDLTVVISLGALAVVTAVAIAIRWRERSSGGASSEPAA